jgi:hypothetical protein
MEETVRVEKREATDDGRTGKEEDDKNVDERKD